MRTSAYFVGLIVGLLPCCVVGCGGGGSSSGSTVVEGTLTEEGGAEHTGRQVLKHGVGEHIGEVTICALGECSVTDSEGRWGFAADVTGGDVHFTVNGHGIDTSFVTDLPPGAENIFLDLGHVEGKIVQVQHMFVDGVEHGEGTVHDHSAEGHQ